MALSKAQNDVIESLKNGNYISYFRGIGTKYPAGASLETTEGFHIKSVSTATIKAMRHKGILEEYERETYHSKYKLKQP